LLRSIRLVAWVFFAGGLFVGQVGWLALRWRMGNAVPRFVLVGGEAGLGLMVVGLFALLRTTPADAIRLPPQWSAGVILGGTLVLQSVALCIARLPLAVSRLGFPVLIVIIAALLVGWLICARRSAWWSVLVAWNPVAVIETHGAARVEIVVGLIIVGGLLVLGDAPRRRGG